jgi:hypothetical protein
MAAVIEFLHNLGALLHSAAQVLRSRYVRELEVENARMREREAALLNTILVSRGLPPLGDHRRNDGSRVAPGRPRTWSEIRAAWEAKDTALGQKERADG